MVIALLLLIVAPALAQEQETKKARPPERGDRVIARGCLRGSVLENAEIAKAEGGERSTELFTYRLTGDKKIIEGIRKEHDGHADVITAELRTDLPKGTRGTKIGNSRITIGVGPGRGMSPEPPPPIPVLRVASLEHTGVSCR
jgi:hypothetical protein